LIDLVDYSTRVKVLLPDEKAASGFASFLFENIVTREVISPCQNRLGSPPEYFTIPRGLYNAIAIYNNGTYLKMDSINLISYSKVVADLSYSSLHAGDSLSRKWQTAAYNNCYRTTVPRIIILRRPGIVYGNIKGTVYAEDNLPLPGANIVIKGTTNGAITDIDGKFALDADEPLVTLVVSFVGYVAKEIEVQIGSEVSLFMEPDIQQLQEIVVVGYGVQTSQNLAFALSGKMAGVQISTPDIVEKAEVPDHVDKKEAERRLYQELLSIHSIRSHFSDVGFWEPKLYTDKDGQSRFKIKYPDDITRWEATVYAMNRRLQTGTTRRTIQSYKPIMTELHTPQFLTRGDSSFFIGKILNYTDERNIAGQAKWVGAQTNFEREVHFTDFHIDKLPVSATSTDSLTLRYMFTRDDGYLDGEQRKVPVVEQGLVRADGTLSVLKNKEEVQVMAGASENITVEILANQLDLYAGEARSLLSYKYDCNEQLASKLLGLINYRLFMHYEAKPFRYDKDVNRIISRLLKNQNEEFLWSWWDVSPNTSYWMSAHILRALKGAKDAGYDVALDVENIRRKAEYKFDILHQQTLSDIDLVHALALWNAHLDYPKHLRKLDSLLVESENEIKRKNSRYYYRYSLLKEKLLLLETKQLVHLSYDRDSLLKYKKQGILGDIHFSDDKSSGYWYNNELTTNAIAYRIVRGDSLLQDLLTPMQMYFLSQRNHGEWNTYHSSNIVTSVLPDLLTAGATKKPGVSISLSGKVNATINQFPYRLELLPEEEVLIRKESGLPVYFMQYKKERITHAKTGVEGFEINTRWSSNQSLLEAGKPATLVVEVNLIKEADLEYVMIEVPIPGACSYSDKTQKDNYIETHREYFKDRTVIFCENMKSGKYVFNIQLLPRFTGKYLINPAQVSLMYVPIVNANTDMKQVRVN